MFLYILSIGFASRGSMDMGKKLFGLLKSFVLGRRIILLFLRTVGKTLLRMDKIYIYRNGVIHYRNIFTNVKGNHGGIQKLSLRFHFCLQKSL